MNGVIGTTSIQDQIDRLAAQPTTTPFMSEELKARMEHLKDRLVSRDQHNVSFNIQPVGSRYVVTLHVNGERNNQFYAYSEQRIAGNVWDISDAITELTRLAVVPKTQREVEAAMTVEIRAEAVDAFDKFADTPPHDPVRETPSLVKHIPDDEIPF